MENVLTIIRHNIERALESSELLMAASVTLRKWDDDRLQRVDNPIGDLKRWLRVDPDGFKPDAFQYNALVRLVCKLQVAIVAPKGRGLKAEVIEWMALAVFGALQPLTRDGGFPGAVPGLEKFDITGGDFAIVDSSVKDKQDSTSDLMWSNVCAIEVTLDVAPEDLATVIGDCPA